MQRTVLIVDDEPTQLKMIEHVVSTKLNYQTVTVNGGKDAVDWILTHKQPEPDVMLLDLSMPQFTGMDVIHALRQAGCSIPIVVLTVHDDLSNAVEAIRAGANDFLSKPAPEERLGVSLQNALQLNLLFSEFNRVRRNHAGQIFFTDLIGISPLWKSAVEMGHKAASSSTPVIVVGEPGTGKEMFARAIHGCSDRAGKPFHIVYCATDNAEKLEAQLFGQEKGSFTGATYQTQGKLREAEGGTILLDDVDKLPVELQLKLQQYLKEGRMLPVGARIPVEVNTRIIATATSGLEAQVWRKRFREDLYYMLNVMPVALPPLRMRKEDVLPLAEHFIVHFSVLENRPLKPLSEAAITMLKSYHWPGNVRQLENAMFRACSLSTGPEIETMDFFPLLQSQQIEMVDYKSHPFASRAATTSMPASDALPAQSAFTNSNGDVRKIIDVEAELIEFALRYYKGHISEVARRLGIGRSTLYRKMHDLGLESARPGHKTLEDVRQAV